MNREETLALWQRCEDARANAKAEGADDAAAHEAAKALWNGWANGVIAKKAELEETGTWSAAARADFRGHIFEEDADFSNFLFPGAVDFNPLKLANGETRPTKFVKDAGFGSATFEGDARFGSATFTGGAEFGSATFQGNAWFGSATFQGNAEFNQGTFRGFTTFRSAQFKKTAGFNAIHADRAFTLENARLQDVPDFFQAHFSEAPRLDNWHIRPPPLIEPGGFWLSILAYVKIFRRFLIAPVQTDVPRPDLAACYRALKRLAIQAHDHEREHRFFAYELRAHRGNPDALLPNLVALSLNLPYLLKWLLFWRKNEIGERPKIWPGGARYWFGGFYQVFSNFGRSLMWPVIWWFVSTGLFAWLYLAKHFAIMGCYTHSAFGWTVARLMAAPPYALTCKAGTGNPFTEAVLLSFRKAVLVLGFEPSEKINLTYACLFGTTQSPFITGSSKRFIPDIPGDIFVWGLCQSLVSAALIFLFLLALRNHFRIK